MDNTTAPPIDLNIDPNMIAPQDSPPQMTPTGTQPIAAPTTPSEESHGVIDITPGTGDVFPPTTSMSSHIDVVPPSEPTLPEASVATTSFEPPVIARSPEETAAVPDVENPPIAKSSPPQAPIPVASSPLAEDPDLVKLIK